MELQKKYYRIALALFSMAIIASIINSIINFDIVSVKINELGYPTYLIFILGLAQTLGLVILITRKGRWLIEWAYAGFFMNLMFGIIAHLLAKDGNGAPAVISLVLLMVTYINHKKMRHSKLKKTITKNEAYTELKKVV